MNVSHRPLYCLTRIENDKNEPQWVTGGADHSLHLITRQQVRKTMYEKQFGHQDWVTSCAWFKRYIIGGGMDSLLSVWDRMGQGKRGIRLNGPITSIQAANELVVGCYDGTITFYDCPPNLVQTKQ